MQTHLEGLELIRRFRSDNKQMVTLHTDNGADQYRHLSFTPHGAELEELQAGLREALATPLQPLPRRLGLLPHKHPDWLFRVQDPFGPAAPSLEDEPLLEMEPTAIIEHGRVGPGWDVYGGIIVPLEQGYPSKCHRDPGQRCLRVLARVAAASLDLDAAVSATLRREVEAAQG